MQVRSIPVEFTAQALRALPCVGEVAAALSLNPEIGNLLPENSHLRQVVIRGFRVTYIVEDEDILVIAAVEAL
jgi:hypothetical protein